MEVKCGEGNRRQAAALESLFFGGAKCILGFSSKTCNEAVRGDMGLETLQGHTDKAKLKLWLPCQRIGIIGSCLLRSGMSSHVEVGRGKFGVG